MNKGSKHTQFARDKMSKAKLGKKITDIHKENIGKASKRRWADPVFNQRMSDSRLGHFTSEETKEKIKTKTSENWKNPEFIEKQRIGVNKCYEDPEYRKRQCAGVKKLWLDPEWAEKTIQHSNETNETIRPNKPEKKVLGILKTLESDIEYVGDGSYWVLGTGKNPDFVNEEKKQIIEVFGCYWHGCKKHFPDKSKQRQNVFRVNKFKKLGYSVLVVWECELKDSQFVIEKIYKFITNQKEAE